MKEDCGISARVGFAVEGVEVAGEVIHIGSSLSNNNNISEQISFSVPGTVLSAYSY